MAAGKHRWQLFRRRGVRGERGDSAHHSRLGVCHRGLDLDPERNRSVLLGDTMRNEIEPALSPAISLNLRLLYWETRSSQSGAEAARTPDASRRRGCYVPRASVWSAGDFIHDVVSPIRRLWAAGLQNLVGRVPSRGVTSDVVYNDIG